MAGETNLDVLLAALAPRLLPDDYVFCSVKGGRYGDYAEASPLASVLEDEGLTLVLTREAADSAGLAYASVFRGITLGAHSSLEAVGLTAAVAGRLADRGISANVLAGCHHDHLFVPAKQAVAAMDALHRNDD